MSLMSKVERGRTAKPPRIFLWIGKSTFGSQAPKPIFIQTEDGLDEIDCDKFPLATTYDDILGTRPRRAPLPGARLRDRSHRFARLAGAAGVGQAVPRMRRQFNRKGRRRLFEGLCLADDVLARDYRSLERPSQSARHGRGSSHTRRSSALRTPNRAPTTATLRDCTSTRRS